MDLVSGLCMLMNQEDWAWNNGLCVNIVSVPKVLGQELGPTYHG